MTSAVCCIVMLIWKVFEEVTVTMLVLVALQCNATVNILNSVIDHKGERRSKTKRNLIVNS